jgi:hypothetical protein
MLERWIEATASNRGTRTTATTLEREQWAEYFRSIVLDTGGVLATVEVTREQLIGPPSGKRRSLHAISYHATKDLLELAVGGHAAGEPRLRYLISAPRTVEVAESRTGRVIVVQDASGTRTLIRLFNVSSLSGVAEQHASRGANLPSQNGHFRRS